MFAAKNTQRDENHEISLVPTANQKMALTFPLAILRTSILAPLESIVKYLRENKQLSYNQIATLLHRNPKTLAATYSVAIRKMHTKFSDNPTINGVAATVLDDGCFEDGQTDNIVLPFTIFAEHLSILESIAHALHSSGRSYSQIARLIGKSQKTIWTVCTRAQAKCSASSSHFPEDILQSPRLPLSIISASPLLAPLESIVLYLRDSCDLSYKQIALLLNRNPKTLAVTYAVAKSKHPSRLIESQETMRVDFSIFSKPEHARLSVLETICSTLHSYDISLKDIAQLLAKNPKTIWTVCNRAAKKLVSYQKRYAVTSSTSSNSVPTRGLSPRRSHPRKKNMQEDHE